MKLYLLQWMFFFIIITKLWPFLFIEILYFLKTFYAYKSGLYEFHMKSTMNIISVNHLTIQVLTMHELLLKQTSLLEKVCKSIHYLKSTNIFLPWFNYTSAIQYELAFTSYKCLNCVSLIIKYMIFLLINQFSLKLYGKFIQLPRIISKK